MPLQLRAMTRLYLSIILVTALYATALGRIILLLCVSILAYIINQPNTIRKTTKLSRRRSNFSMGIRGTKTRFCYFNDYAMAVYLHTVGNQLGPPQKFAPLPSSLRMFKRSH